MKRTKIILFEPQENLRNSVQFSLESNFSFDVIASGDIDSCIKDLNTHENICLLVAAGKDKGIETQELFTFAKDNLGEVPIISTDADISTKWEGEKDIIIKHFNKRDIIDPLVDTVKELFTIDETEEKEEFTMISINALSFLSVLREDFYIKLPKTGRLLKLFSKNDEIYSEDIDKYSKKNVEHLYIDKEAATWILKNIQGSIDNIIEDEEFRIDIDSHPEPQKDLVEEVEENIFDQSKEFIQMVHESKKKIITNLKKNKDFSKRLASIPLSKGEDAFYRNRIKLVCAISCALAKEMGWSTEAAFEKMIYAAHVHDLVLIDYKDLWPLQTQGDAEVLYQAEKIDRDKKALFMDHPKIAAELVAKDKKAPPDAEQLIAQHHESPNGEGFPHKLAATRIPALSAILIVSIDIAQSMLTKPSFDKREYYMKNKMRFKGGSFSKIMQAFAKLSKIG